MERTERLMGAELEAAASALEGWRVEDERLVRDWRFSDFSEAFAFMTRVALAAERLGHHPDWTNVYDKVTIRLWTHDEGCVTGRDLELARTIDALAGGGKT